MTVQFAWDFAGETRIQRRIHGMDAAMLNLAPFFESLWVSFASQEARTFASEGSAGGEPWKELSPAYAVWKERNYPGKPILQREGSLVESLTGEGNEHTVRRISPLMAEFGTSLEYATYHQDGTGRMPARPPLQFKESTKKLWMQMLRRHIMSGAGSLPAGAVAVGGGE